MNNNTPIPAGFKKLEQEELVSVLSNTGNRGLGYFFAGDEITIEPDAPVVARYDDEHSENGTARKPVPYIGVTVNGNDRWVPFASFRRWPSKDSAGFAERSPLMKSLFVGSDADRLEILRHAKTIVVKEMVEGETRDWSRGVDGKDENGNILYRTTKFPVLISKE